MAPRHVDNRDLSSNIHENAYASQPITDSNEDRLREKEKEIKELENQYEK